MKQNLLPTLRKIVIGLAPALLLAVVALAVFFTTLVISNRTFYVFPDNIDQFYAWYQKLTYALHQGTLPIWDANVSSGHSFVGELQAGVFYPVNLAWTWLFGSGQGISIFWLELIVVFHFWLASLGMYLAARSLGLGRISSLASGIIFAYGGALAMRSVSQTAIFFGLCFIPWAFFWFNRWLQTKNKWMLVGTGISLGMIILAGHIQPWFHACLILFFFILFRPRHPGFAPWLKTFGVRLAGLAAAAGISLLVALPQVILTAQYLPQAYRFVGDSQPIGPEDKVSIGTFTKSYSYEPQGLLSLVNPIKFPVVDGNELYVGLIGLTAILATVFVARRGLLDHVVWRLNGRFIVGASAAAAIIMIGYWTFIPAVMRVIPLLSQVRQLARYSIIIHFCLAILVGICIEVLANRGPELLKGRKRQLMALAVCGFLALNSAYLFVVASAGHFDKHFVYQSAIVAVALGLCVMLRSRIRLVLLGAVIAFSIAQPVWFLPRIDKFTSTYPPNYYERTAAITFLEQHYGQARVIIEDSALPVNVGDVYNIQTINGYGATLHEAYYDYLNEPDPEGRAGEHMDLLNVRFVVAKKPHPELRMVLHDDRRGIFVYERPLAAPRAYFADHEEDCRLARPACTPPRIEHYSDSLIRVSYDSAEDRTLVLSEVFYTGWQAFVDAKPVAMQRHRPGGSEVGLFRAVDVPSGKHVVEFRYKPFGF